MRSEVRRIVGAYRSRVIRLYCTIRFQIIHQRFLYEIGQYLPRTGRVLDCGCGFGLFSLYFAVTEPGRELHGFDLQAHRIEAAISAARAIGVSNVKYWAEDVRSFVVTERFRAIYMLDIVHHIRKEEVQPLLSRLNEVLEDEGILIIKDVTDRPFWKRWFTWLLDKAMDPRTPVHYWSQEALRETIEKCGFEVRSHEMVDYLPYPHIVYVCRKSLRLAESH